MTGNAAGTPLATFQELAAQYHHRLLSLEADLKDQARSGGLSARAFARRVRRLKNVHEDLGKLARLCMAEEPGKLTAADIGLPVLDDCTPAEHAVCEAFLVEKEASASRLVADTRRVYRWLSEAVTGHSGPLLLTLRLSRLRRLIDNLEKRTAALGEADQAMAAQADRLLATVKRADGKESGRTTLDGLMELFQRLDRTIGRVARLKAMVKKEDARTQAMAAWLRNVEGEMATTRPQMAAPTPLAVSQATASERSGQERQRRRRNLITQFWDEVVQKGLAAPEDNDPLGTAAVAIKRELAARDDVLRTTGGGSTPSNPYMPTPRHPMLRRRKRKEG